MKEVLQKARLMGMQIWLPPSESKHSPTTGPTLDLDKLSLPALNDQRRLIAEALLSLGTGDDAAHILGLGAKSKADLALNATLWDNPCAPMQEVFIGVLYSAANLGELDEATVASSRDRLTIFSGLFGAVRLGDLIPDHRLSMGVKLPHIGGLAAAWKPVLEKTLQDEYPGNVILDMRSGPYRHACPAQWAHVWQVGVVREAAGQRTVVSHNAKYWRGLLTGHLLRLPDADWPTADTSHAQIEEILLSARALPAMVDAKDVEHRITDVEFSSVTTHKAGGSTRRVTIVTN